MRAKYLSPFLWLFFLSNVACSQAYLRLDTTDLLHSIQREQSQGDKLYNKGVFKSERYMLSGNHAHQDNNIFFTALSVYTLQDLRDSFSPDHLTIANEICENAIAAYPFYRSRNMDPTFNYWRVRPETPMPGSIWQNTNRARLPDDMDDSSLILLTGTHSDSLKHAFRTLMSEYTNHRQVSVKSIFKRYQDYPAYLTWFADKLKQDMDICVLANVLLFVEDEGFTLNHHDSASAQLIATMVQNNDHINHPEIISPYYENTAIIIHTLARLLSHSSNTVLLSLREQLIHDALAMLPTTENRMEQILLITSIYQLQGSTKARVNLSKIEESFDGFSYFYTNPFHGSHIFWKRLIGKSKFLQLHARSHGFYYTLVLEYLMTVPPSE